MRTVERWLKSHRVGVRSAGRLNLAFSIVILALQCLPSSLAALGVLQQSEPLQGTDVDTVVWRQAWCGDRRVHYPQCNLQCIFITLPCIDPAVSF